MTTRLWINAAFVTVFSVLAIWQIQAAEDTDCVWTCTPRRFCMFGPNPAVNCNVPACHDGNGSCVGREVRGNPNNLTTIDAAIEGGSNERSLSGMVACFRTKVCGETAYNWYFECKPNPLTTCIPGNITQACPTCGYVGTPVDFNVHHYTCPACTGA